MNAPSQSSISLPVVGRPVRRSRNAPRRAIVLAVVQLLIVAHIVQWMVTGRSISPVEPSESMETVKHGVINAGAIFFALALVATLVLGRWFCGWGCHLVMLQDGCAWIMRRCGIRPRAFRSRLLVYVPFVLGLYMFVWPAVYRWSVVPLSARLHGWIDLVPALDPLPKWTGFSVEVVTSDFWATFPGWLVAVPFLLICGFATVYFLGAKGFCTYGCPYGGLFAPLEQFAVGRIRVNDACEHCGHCTAVCSSNVRVHEEVREFGMVVDPGCMKCLDCVSVCPNDALSFGFGPPATRKGAPRDRGLDRTYDLTLGEEIGCAVVFLISFLAWRGVYDAIPMLMAVGIAGCLTFSVWKLWRMTRAESVSLHKFRLRFKGALTRAGLAFAAIVVAAGALTAHGGAVNALAAAADRAARRVTMQRADVFGPAPRAMPPEMTADADRAIGLYRRAAWLGDGGIGLLPQPENEIQVAWLHACKGDFAEAARRLRRYADRHGPTDPICRDVILLLDRDGRPEAAGSFARETIERHRAFVLTTDEEIRRLLEEGRVEEAIALCRASVARNADDPEARLYLLRRLSLLLVDHGDIDEGIRVFRETIEMDDRNVSAFVMLAEAYRKKGEPLGAIEPLERAIELAPDRADLMLRVAALLETAGRPIEADAYRARASAVGAATDPRR